MPGWTGKLTKVVNLWRAASTASQIAPLTGHKPIATRITLLSFDHLRLPLPLVRRAAFALNTLPSALSTIFILQKQTNIPRMTICVDVVWSPSKDKDSCLGSLFILFPMLFSYFWGNSFTSDIAHAAYRVPLLRNCWYPTPKTDPEKKKEKWLPPPSKIISVLAQQYELTINYHHPLCITCQQ